MVPRRGLQVLSLFVPWCNKYRLKPDTCCDCCVIPCHSVQLERKHRMGTEWGQSN